MRQSNADQRAGRRVHRRFFQLVRVHFTQALEPANIDFLALEHGRFQFGAVRVVGGVDALAAMRQAIERRPREKEMPGLHDFGHFLKEECHQQGRNMRAIDIRVSHDDDAFIAQIVGVAVLARATAKRELKISDFVVGADFVCGGRRHVQDFTPDRQNRLSLAVTRLLCAAASAVAFDDEQFGAGRVIRCAIGQLAGQTHLAARGRGFAFDFTLCLTAQAVVDLFQDEAHQRLAAFHIVGKIMVEMVPHGVFHQARCFG